MFSAAYISVGPDMGLTLCRVRLISLAAQKMLASICHDAYQIQKRQLLSGSRSQRNTAAEKRPVLTSEILSQALREVMA